MSEFSGRRGAVILCGGRSVRMGCDKASVAFRGEALLTRVARRVAAALPDVVVVARAGQVLPPLPPACRIVFDDVPDLGPLGGLGPGLRASQADAVFVTGCDAPFVSVAVIDLLFRRLGGAEAAVAFDGDRACPLCAVVRTSAGAAVASLVAAGRLRASGLVEALGAVRVLAEDLRSVDPRLLCLVNCNTPEALARAETLLAIDSDAD